jgi:hypothetical protein
MANSRSDPGHKGQPLWHSFGGRQQRLRNGVDADAVVTMARAQLQHCVDLMIEVNCCKIPITLIDTSKLGQRLEKRLRLMI